MIRDGGVYTSFASVVIPGIPHHITHRGNRRDVVFFSAEDREGYLVIM